MKKGAILLLTAAIAFGGTSALHAEDLGDEGRITNLETKVAELENRISQLELLLSSTDGQVGDFSSPFNLASGVYVGGEDIPVGDYSFKVTTGQGTFSVFSSYDDYATDEYSFKTMYMLMDESTRNSMAEQGYGTTVAAYTSELGNIKITDGLCIAVEGVTLEGTRR